MTLNLGTMTDLFLNGSKLPPEQELIRAKCFHPAGNFIEFTKDEIHQSIPARFEEQVASYPNGVAVRGRGRQFSYSQLNSIANRLARAILRRCQDKPEPVALLLGHDAMMVASIIGVMKAGKTCVPLESGSPHARIGHILEDLQTRLIVTNNNYLSAASRLASNPTRIINIDELDAALGDDNIRLTISPETLAYILYTSGSTGQPKGVTQTHRNALHSAMMYINNLHIQADDRLTLFGSCSGGQGMKLVISALITGASLYPWNISDEGLATMANWLIAEGITIYISGATVFRSFVTTLSGEEEFPALRIIRVGNEPVRQTDVEAFKKHFSPHSVFVNWFAVTEAGNVACYFADKQNHSGDDLIPIGYATDDTEILILDDGGQQVGPDQPGEIGIKSRYLSPGYWRQPDLTRAKFLTDPIGGEERTFLSGDLGVMRSDGCLYHAGRKDFQVKISGNRIETGEVESALLAVDGITEAVVVAQNHGADTRLLAYIVTDAKPSPDIRTIRRALAETLPPHMIPSAFVPLESMPVTANGKIDRRALPAPEQARPDLSVDYVTPRTNIEQSLARIWAGVIGLTQIGVHDDFFELGGHSMAAIQIVSQVIKEFGLEVPLQLLFQSPTVAEMAVAIDEYQGKKLGKEKINQILTELESLTEEEARRLIGEDPSKDRN